MALGFYSVTSQADVTGYFETHISFEPQTTADEVSKFDFDFQNDLTVTVAISGLYTTLHTHFGVAGIEDVIVTFAATLGALEVEDEFVFGRFAYGSTTPFYDTLHFIKKRVSASISLGGVTFSNLALIEDVNAFGAISPAFGLAPQSPTYAFGDVMTISGTTPSGISITGETGICAKQGYNLIKKHYWYYYVNPECAYWGGVFELKPNIMFDFEKLYIEGIPLAAGVTGDWDIVCETVTACTLDATISFSGGPIPFSTSFTFTDLLTLSMGTTTLTLTQGAGTLIIEIDPTGVITLATVDLSMTLNPDTNPASLEVSMSIAPGTGISDADVNLEISRAGLSLGVYADFNPGAGGVAEFSSVTFSLGTSAGMFDVITAATFTPTGLLGGDVYLTVSF